MSARAEAVEATRARIVTAALEAFTTQWYDDVTVRAIAANAGVALQTVVNHFPTKDALCAAANERFAADIESARWAVEAGDVVGGVETLVDDYERTGDATLRMLAVEERVPAVQPWIALGRRKHEEWVVRTFPAALARTKGRSRARRIAQLVVATDVYAWKILRRDKGLTRDETVLAMRELVVAIHHQSEKGTVK